MEERYEWLHRARVRNIASYNDLPFEEIARRVNPDSEEELRNIPRKMPYIVIVIDEVADLIMQMKKEIESSIILLAQKFARIESQEATMTAVDRLGFYVRLKTSDGMRGARVAFPREARDSAATRTVLVEMVRQARSQSG